MTWLNTSWIEHLKEPEIQHCSSRYSYPIDAIFLHYTAGGHYLRSTWTWWTMREALSSAHFIVGRVGQVVQCVPMDLRAWHAGQARFLIREPISKSCAIRPRPDRSAIGIEMSNFGLLEKEEDSGEFYYGRSRQTMRYKKARYGDPVRASFTYRGPVGDSFSVEGWWERYSTNQVSATALLCASLISLYDIPIERIVGHQDVAWPPGRKTDPGALWSWTNFKEELAGMLKIPLEMEKWCQFHRWT